MRDFIPQIEPWIDSNELRHLSRVIDSTFVVEHKMTEEFEEKVKEHTSAKHAMAVANGTLALYTCLKALEIGQGDEVIVPNLTFIATSNAVIMAGATPVFCDIERETLCIDPDKIKNSITDKTKAITPVHLYGQSADMDKIMKIAKDHSLKVIEDAAQGVGVFYKGKHVGTIGDCGILSYYGNKTITCGEGGIILTNDDEIVKKCFRLKNHGRDRRGIFKHEHIGFNFSITDMQSAIGVSQMEKLPIILHKKKEIFENYVKGLSGVGDIKFQKFEDNVKPVHWFTSIFTNKNDELSKFLLEQNIQTRGFFYPLHLQPCYNKNGEKYVDFPVSEEVYNLGLSLPSSYGLSSDNQKYIISTIKKFF